LSNAKTGPVPDDDVIGFVVIGLGDARKQTLIQRGFRREDVFDYATEHGVVPSKQGSDGGRGKSKQPPGRNYFFAGPNRLRNTWTSAFTVNSIKRNGLAIKSFPPLMVEFGPAFQIGGDRSQRRRGVLAYDGNVRKPGAQFETGHVRHVPRREKTRSNFFLRKAGPKP